MKNNNQKRFLDIVEKLDGINIILKFNPGEIFKEKIFFN